MCFRYVCRLTSPTMESTKVGAPPKAARPPLWRRPKAASIVGDGEAVCVCLWLRLLLVVLTPLIPITSIISYMAICRVYRALYNKLVC